MQIEVHHSTDSELAPLAGPECDWLLQSVREVHLVDIKVLSNARLLRHLKFEVHSLRERHIFDLFESTEMFGLWLEPPTVWIVVKLQITGLQVRERLPDDP
jgi:hypothetical protein